MRGESPSEIGPYRVIRRIATGGMAEIYLARQRAIEGVERTVVIKQILPKYASDDEFITMFMDEARLLAALSHPHIAQVFDVGKEASSYYLAMEYVRGPTLGKVLARCRDRDERLPRREALGIALQIAEALHYAHERRDEVGRPLEIVHRDLNPANVLISFDGAVKLIDFGIAKAATKVYETRTGVIKGTYGYIAPEQLVGTTPVDRRADVFALGILMYEMVVGSHPFDVSDEPNLVDRILEARYPKPRQVRSDIPRALDRLISSCLTPHPEGRPEDMGVLIEAISTHLGEHGMVPTQLALSRTIQKYVPDDEGPRPLRAPTSPNRPRPFGADPSGTRKLGLDLPGAPDTEPRHALAEPRPSEIWDEATVTFDDDQPLTLAGPTDGELPVADGEDEATIARPRPAVDDGTVEEAPTRLVTIRDAPSRRRSDEATYVPPRRKGGRSGAPIALIAIGALLAMAVVGALSFALVRLLGSSRAEVEAPPSEPPVVATEPSEVTLSIVSDPSGATVYVDGRALEEVTPARVQLPPGTDEVWVQVRKDGFETEERSVIATVGEARFVLRPRE